MGIVDLGLGGGFAGQGGRLTVPVGESSASLRESGHGWYWSRDEETGSLSALGRPSWLLHSSASF